jgi:hypothetical protein
MMFSVGHVMFRSEFYQVFTDVLLRQNMMCHLTNMCCYMWSYHTFSELDRTIPQAHTMMFSVGHVMFRIEFYQVFTDVLLRQNMMCHLTNMCCYMWSYHTFSELDRTIPQADCGQFPSYSQT